MGLQEAMGLEEGYGVSIGLEGVMEFLWGWGGVYVVTVGLEEGSYGAGRERAMGLL